MRVSIFEARVLSQSLWSEFQIWGCGRDARNFIAALSENAKKKIIAIVDIDEKKKSERYANNLPIEHFSAARRGVCTVVCVSERRKGTISKDVDDELIENVSASRSRRRFDAVVLLLAGNCEFFNKNAATLILLKQRCFRERVLIKLSPPQKTFL